MRMNISRLHSIFIQECDQTICTDTRKIVTDSLFFALKGEQFDGNTFAEEALSRGCNYAVVDDPQLSSIPGCIVVPDTTVALQELAHYHRKQFTIPVVAIAGSNGKTTTKELLKSVLSLQKRVTVTQGNLNNHIGVPLTLLRITKYTDIAVIEMGANAVGEIAHLCTIAEPTAGVITNFGRDHLGFFNGVAGVIESNLELYHYLQKNNGHVFVNGSDEALMRYSQGLSRTVYGPVTKGMFNVSNLHPHPLVSVQWDHIGRIDTQLVGEYNMDNIAAAISIGIHYGIVNENIKKGIESYQPTNNRSEIHSGSNGNLVIKDFYNANTSSMEAAIENAAHIKGGMKLILILGDMFEMGPYAQEEHQRVSSFALERNPDELIVVGDEFSKVAIHSNAEVVSQFQTIDEAIAHLNATAHENTLFLIKASHGMNFQKLFSSVQW